MRLTQIDLNLYTVFDAVYRERNLTRAAEALSVTQPAVSNALSRLRAALNDPLFVRAAGGMRPTPFAESIADRVGDALHQLSVSAQKAARFDPARSNRVFRISMLDLFDGLVLKDLVAALGRQAPQVALRSFRLPRADLLGALSHGAVDIAADIALIDTTNLVRAPFLTERHVCALRPGHPLADDALTLERYLALGHIHVSGRRRGSGPVDLALKAAGTRRRIQVRLEHYLAVRDLVLSTDLAVSLPENWARTLGLTYRALPFDVPPLETYLYRHRRSDEDESVLWLFGVIVELAGRLRVPAP